MTDQNDSTPTEPAHVEFKGDPVNVTEEIVELERRLDRLWSQELKSNFRPKLHDVSLVPHYQIRKILGSGAFGIVYLADDQKRNRMVALKIPRPEVLVDKEKRRRFSGEAAMAARLDHPGIVPVYEASLTAPTPFIATAFCDGPNLAEWLAEQKELSPWRESVELVAKIADAVAHAHEHGVFHRDLKPANVMLATKSDVVSDTDALSNFDPRITDFGLAKLSEPTLSDTRSSLMIGTPMYMAPEQMDPSQKGNVSATADIYALGVILFELLTGHLPVVGDTYFEVLDNIRNSSPTRLKKLRKDLPTALDKICATCLKKNPQARYASVADFAQDLRNCIAGATVAGKPLSLLKRACYWCTRRQRMVTAGSFAIGSQALIAFWAIQGGILVYAYDIVSWDQYMKMLPDVFIVVLLIHLPLAVCGWFTLQGKRWAACTGLILTALNIPPVVIAILTEPMLFRELYLAHNAYFSFNAHSIILICFVTQLFLFGFAVACCRTERRLAQQRV